MNSTCCLKRTVLILASYTMLILAIFHLSIEEISAQNDIPKFGKENRSLKISGGLRLMTDLYAYSGITPRRDPFQFRAQARLNLNAFGINAPFTFNFSDGNQTFNLPSYTFTGISPTYKMATVHLGDRSLLFSKYTLGNITFRGAGLELRPGKFYLAGMYGRIKRAVAEDLDALQNFDTAYKRMGYGIKLGYQGDKSKLTFILFGAKDDESSIADPIALPITPNANLVASIQGFQQITNKVNVNIEWAHSLFNKDTRALALQESMGFGKTYGGLFTPNASFQAGDAFNTKVNYIGKNFGLNTSYERISRGFRTLGAIFFNNDLENITAGFTKSLLNNKLNLSINGGLERANLDEFVAEKTSRVIGSMNITYTPSINWNYSTQYSNFQNSTKLRATNNLELFVDSVFLSQVTQSASFTATHMMGPKGENGSFTGIISFQNANSIIEDEISESQTSDFWYGSFLYRSARKENFSWGASISYNQSTFDEFSTRYITPSFLADHSFLNERLIFNAILSINHVSQEIANTLLLNFGLGTIYKLNDDNTISFSSNIIQKFGDKDTLKGFFESYINLTYAYRFKKEAFKKKEVENF